MQARLKATYCGPAFGPAAWAILRMGCPVKLHITDFATGFTFGPVETEHGRDWSCTYLDISRKLCGSKSGTHLKVGVGGVEAATGGGGSV